jgi:hypothetical protein
VEKVYQGCTTIGEIRRVCSQTEEG